MYLDCLQICEKYQQADIFCLILADILAFTFSKSVNMQKRANHLFCTGIIGEKGDFSERV